MAAIKTLCPTCKTTVAIETQALLLAIRPSRPATYTLQCTTCYAISVKTADTLAEALLRRAGAIPTPAAPRHPEQPVDGPALTHDDLLELHDRLSTPNWLDELTTP
jgi:hypothetical protein